MKIYEQPALELIKFSIMDVLDINNSLDFEAGSATIPESGSGYNENGGGIL